MGQTPLKSAPERNYVFDCTRARFATFALSGKPVLGGMVPRIPIAPSSECGPQADLWFGISSCASLSSFTREGGLFLIL
jgi:hypothetical protein